MSIDGGGIDQMMESPITECSRFGKKVCSIPTDISMMKTFLRLSGLIQSDLDASVVIDAMKTKLGVANEADIYENRAFQNMIGYGHAKEVLEKEFLPKGPATGTALLDNYHIDNSLKQWSLIGDTESKKKFYHIPFQMIDFANTKTELDSLNIVDLIKKKYDSFGVIINTDVSSGRGIHWLKQIIALGKTGIKAESISATGGKQIQYSNTECGVWSLIYIKSRLTGDPYDRIIKSTDAQMIELRSKLFRQ